MACATLKRSWEFDPVHSPGRPNKRPRCTPMCVSPTSSSPPPAKKSHFDTTKMTPDEMAASIRMEMERLNKRNRQGDPSHVNFPLLDIDEIDLDGMPMSPDPDAQSSNKLKKQALYTHQQVQFICSRMVNDRENALRQEYDEILHSKLMEQYDTFVKFSRDQIQRHFPAESTPSYLS